VDGVNLFKELIIDADGEFFDVVSIRGKFSLCNGKIFSVNWL
jgi:hypothetical protein